MILGVMCAANTLVLVASNDASWGGVSGVYDDFYMSGVVEDRFLQSLDNDSANLSLGNCSGNGSANDSMNLSMLDPCFGPGSDNGVVDTNPIDVGNTTVVPEPFNSTTVMETTLIAITTTTGSILVPADTSTTTINNAQGTTTAQASSDGTSTTAQASNTTVVSDGTSDVLQVVMTIDGLDWNVLSANNSVLQPLKEALEVALAGQIDGVEPDDVECTLSPGSVQVVGQVSLPGSLSIDAASAQMNAATLSATFVTGVLAIVNSIPGISSAITGDLGVSGIVVSSIDPGSNDIQIELSADGASGTLMGLFSVVVVAFSVA